jgi:hypothetical protein
MTTTTVTFKLMISRKNLLNSMVANNFVILPVGRSRHSLLSSLAPYEKAASSIAQATNQPSRKDKAAKTKTSTTTSTKNDATTSTKNDVTGQTSASTSWQRYIHTRQHLPNTCTTTRTQQ